MSWSARRRSCGGSRVSPTTAAFRNVGCSPFTSTGAVSCRDENWDSVRKVERREVAKSRCASRSPRFEPSAIATRGVLFNPAGLHHLADPHADVRGATAQEIVASRQRLLEEALLLERLAQDDAQHAAMAGVGHRLDPRFPALHERFRIARVLVEETVRSSRSLA